LSASASSILTFAYATPFAVIADDREKLKEIQKFVSTLDRGALGASGSVMAISLVAACLFPWDKILVGRIGFYLSLPFAVATYLVSDLLGIATAKANGVANAGHLGGASVMRVLSCDVHLCFLLCC
jgi:membrane associated rhomboid family serine protease